MKPYFDRDGMTFYDDEQELIVSQREDSPLILFKRDKNGDWERKHLSELLAEDTVSEG